MDPALSGAMLIAWSTYENERLAARVTDALLSTGFTPTQIHAVVKRDESLRRAPVGRRYRIGYAALVGGTLAAAVGSILAAVVATGAITVGVPVLDGLRPLAAAILAVAPCALVGALVGAVFGIYRWRASSIAFPAARLTQPAFVAVRVSSGTAPLARRVLELEHHPARFSETEDPMIEARVALEHASEDRLSATTYRQPHVHPHAP